MTGRLGETLVKTNKITEEQLRQALDRQRVYGGRIGANLVALGFIREEDVQSVFHPTPPQPKTIEETRLPPIFLADLVTKHTFFMGEFTLSDMVEAIKLPASVLGKVIETLRKEQLLEVKGGGQASSLSFRYAATGKGRDRGQELLAVSGYVGPAPVVLGDYRTMVETQTVKSVLVNEGTLNQAFSGLIVNKGLLAQLGPAMSSGKSIFLYGPAGNGKTTIAETLGRLLPGAVFLPYAVLVAGQIVTVHDPGVHGAGVPGDPPEARDMRWLRVKRPLVTAGGELTLKSLELEFNPVTRIHEAPLQMKANNGLLIVDDFGRQQVDPQNLLNRWIVPLERRTDFLSLDTGTKFEIPFDQIVLFSTNIEPKKLVDEAFLRRIHYKIRIDHPGLDEYEQIFRAVCDSNGIPFRKAVFDSLLENYYRRYNVRLNACHPRDLVDHIIHRAHYAGKAPELTEEAIAYAWGIYFVEM